MEKQEKKIEKNINKVKSITRTVTFIKKECFDFSLTWPLRTR